MEPGFLKKPAREILLGATFVMGILYVPYAIYWPILPQHRVSALPWLLLVVVCVTAAGWMLRQWVQSRREEGTGHPETRRRDFPRRLPLAESLMRPVKEILTQTILCVGGVFAVMAVFVPLLRTEPVGVSPWGPLAYLVLVATLWIGAQWSRKRRQSGGAGRGGLPGPRVS